MNRAGEPPPADALIQRLVADADDEAATDLLRAFFHGLPVERLTELLRSDSEHAVKAGAWIASELGPRAEPLVPELAPLLDHHMRYVRFFVIDALLASATPEHGPAIARALSRLRDTDDAVRWKAMNFLARASEEQLTASRTWLDDAELRSQIEWLRASTADADAIAERLETDDELGQLVAAAAAARLAPRDSRALVRASRSRHPEVRSFAREILEAR